MNPDENPSPPPAHVHPQPSDRPDHHPPPIGKVSSINGSEEMNKQEDRSELLLQEEDEREQKGNNFRKENFLGAKAVSGFLPDSSSNSSPVLSRWCEGERAFPPKKRRGLSFERSGGSSSSDNGSKTGTKITKPKTNSSKKSYASSATTSRKNDDDDIDQVKDATKQTKTAQHNSNSSKKTRGGALMEGSRCSRVNGRGWRCCQQTLVGYSLCEHHLGKGRLRSMTSVRSRSLAKSSNPPPPPKPAIVHNNHGEITNVGKRDDEDEGNNVVVEEVKIAKPLMATMGNIKKRVKLGMVKARSISSLLGQTSGAIPMADLNK